jgi:type I restriction enzyme R subunit
MGGPNEAEPEKRPKQIKIRLADGKERLIQRLMATTYWSFEGKPISVNQMIERLWFSALPVRCQELS